MEDYLDTGEAPSSASGGGFTLRDSGQSTHHFLEDMKRFMSGTRGEVKAAGAPGGLDRVGNNVVIGGGQGGYSIDILEFWPFWCRFLSVIFCAGSIDIQAARSFVE